MLQALILKSSIPLDTIRAMETTIENTEESGITCEKVTRDVVFHYTGCICTILARTDGNIVQCFNII